jgi:hypothetical protein
VQTLRYRRHLPTSSVSIRLAWTTRSEFCATRAQWIATPQTAMLPDDTAE